jgi:hypothetical protein
MFGKNAIIIDVIVGGTLGLALLMVFFVDRMIGKSKTQTTPANNTLHVVEIKGQPADDGADGPRVIARKLRLAVTPSHPVNPNNFNDKRVWDDMGKLLRGMGDDYRFQEIHPVAFARTPEALDGFDVLFLTCSPQMKDQDLSNALVRFVKRGGTLYASDWRFDDIARAFPAFVDRSLAGDGMGQQRVVADVVDPGLKDFVGPNVPLFFDLNAWKTAAFAGPNVTTLLKGQYRQMRVVNNRVVPAGMAEAPLLVKFQVGKGTVIFTSFHNEKQNSDIEKKLLQFLVFTLIVADIDAQVTAEIREAGFKPQKSNLLTTTKENSVKHKFQHAQPGPLRVTLGFRDAGATLQLTIISPDGRSFTWKGTSTATLEVPDAVIGEWSYTVTAVNIPDNFPFTVTISQKK